MLGEDCYEGVLADPKQTWEERKAAQNRRLFAEHPEQVWVLDADGRIIGFVTFWLFPERSYGHLDNNAVDPARAGEGWATFMYRHVLEHFRELGLRFAHVDTGLDDAHIPARRAYAAVGFDRSVPSVDLWQRLGWTRRASTTTSRSRSSRSPAAPSRSSRRWSSPRSRPSSGSSTRRTAWATWMLTGFLVSAAVTTPILGRLGDQFGKKRVLIVSLSLFALGCLGAASAWNIWSLIAFRVVSGAGGALFPLELRDHPRRVPAGEGEGRNRAAVCRLGRRRRLRDRALRGDRRPRVVALALRARLDPGGDHDRADPPARPRVAGALPVARGLPRRAAAGGSAARR